MTPVLCLNCGKAYDEHEGSGWCHSNDNTRDLRIMRWRDSAAPDPCEQRTVEAIVKFIVGDDYERHGSPAVALYTIDLANRIRSGAWKEKP